MVRTASFFHICVVKFFRVVCVVGLCCPVYEYELMLVVPVKSSNTMNVSVICLSVLHSLS